MEPGHTFGMGALSLSEYADVLRRRRVVIVCTFLLVSIAGIFMTLMMKPVYHASAKLLIESPANSMSTVDTSNPLSSLFVLNQQQSLETQVAVLQTKPLIEAVANQIGKKYGLAELTISPIHDANIIEVDADAHTPQAAEAAPNLLLNMYVAQITKQDTDELNKAQAFVRQRSIKAHQNLVAADGALKAFKLKNHIADLAKNRDDAIARVSTLRADEQKARTDLGALRAQIALNRHLLALEPATLMMQVKATNSVIADLNDRISGLQVQREGMLQPGQYKPNAPQVKVLDAQIKLLQDKKAGEPVLAISETSSPNAVHEVVRSKIVAEEADASALDAQVASLTAGRQQAEIQVQQYADWDVTISQLTRDRDDAASADQMFQSKLVDLSLRKQARHVAARVIEYADLPTAPIRPQKTQNILASCLAGLLAGLLMALLQEFADDRLNSVEEAGRLLGLPLLGHIPTLSGRETRLLPQMSGLSVASDSYRVLRTNIYFTSLATAVRTLLVTSASNGEGKTTTAANLAFAMAMDGKRVILVDADLRRPSLSQVLDIPSRYGLTDVLIGGVALEDVLWEHSAVPGLTILPCGTTPPNPSELIGSSQFRDFVGHLAERADTVIFDSSPLLAGADSTILAGQMDGVVLVVEAGKTNKTAAKHAISLLRQARASLLGVAYNKLPNFDRHRYYPNVIPPQLADAGGERTIPVPETRPEFRMTPSPAASADQTALVHQPHSKPLDRGDAMAHQPPDGSS